MLQVILGGLTTPLVQYLRIPNATEGTLDVSKFSFSAHEQRWLRHIDTLETKLARWLLVHGVATSKTFSQSPPETRRGETSSAWEKTFVSARENKHATTHAMSLKDLTKLAVDNDGTSEAGGAQAEET